MSWPEPSVPMIFPAVAGNYSRERELDDREMTVDSIDIAS